MENIPLTIRKTQYESSSEEKKKKGLVLFDTLVNTIRVEGNEYGPLSAFEPSNQITSSSTNQQLATAKAVYDAIQDSVSANYENLLSTPSSNDSGPSRVPAPYVSIDTTSTSVTMNTLLANYVYIYTQQLTKLQISNAIDSALETTVYFKTNASTTFELLLPQGLYKTNDFIFGKGKSFVLSIKNSVVSCEEIVSYVEGESIIFGSSQLEGGYIDTPTIYESAQSDPVVSTVMPNSVYKFGTCDTITLNNIPSNSLETLVYWTSGTNTTLYLSGDSTTTLKTTPGSHTVFKNSKYVMSIKDGVIIITKLTTV